VDLTYHRDVNEREGSALLRRVFETAGIKIEEAVKKRFDAGEVTLDGWDDAKRIGFEFITTEAGDRSEFTVAVLEEIERRMSEGEFFLFLIDEETTAEEATLERAAHRFLDTLRKRGALG
jgi:hypothetical protein